MFQLHTNIQIMHHKRVSLEHQLFYWIFDEQVFLKIAVLISSETVINFSPSITLIIEHFHRFVVPVLKSTGTRNVNLP